MSTEGVIGFVNPNPNTIRITFEDQKTDREKIISALIKGGVAIPGEMAPSMQTPNPDLDPGPTLNPDPHSYR